MPGTHGENKYVLFGPPASGKSTLVQHLPCLRGDITGIDLELVTNGHRLEFAKSLSGMTFQGPLFIGAADLQFEDLRGLFKIIFLFPKDRQKYMSHVRARSRSRPDKAGQREGEIYDGMSKLPRDQMFVTIDSLEESEDGRGLAGRVLEKLGLMSPADFLPWSAERPPMRLDEGGVVRLGQSRVSLDLVVEQFENGMTAEEMARAYDSLRIADVYAAVAYYLRHREEVRAYLKRRKAQADGLRAELEAGRPGPSPAELAARRAEKKGHAPAGQ